LVRLAISISVRQNVHGSGIAAVREQDFFARPEQHEARALETLGKHADLEPGRHPDPQGANPGVAYGNLVRETLHADSINGHKIVDADSRGGRSGRRELT